MFPSIFAPSGRVASSPDDAIVPPLVLGPAYLLDDEFTSDAITPLTSPRTCEPGPGTLTLTDTTNLLSIAAGVLSGSGAAAGAADPAVAPASTMTRAAGLAMFARVKELSGAGSAGGVGVIWAGSGAPTTGLDGLTFFGNGAVIRNQGSGLANIIGIIVTADDTYYVVAIVLRTLGSFIFLNNELVWVVTTNIAANRRPAVFNTGAGKQPFAIDWLRVQQLSAPFDDDYGIATFTDTSVADGDTFVSNADAIIDFTYTLPSSPSAGQIIGIKFRQSDASNYWIAYVKRNAGNTNWDFLVDSVVAGVPTNRVSVTSTNQISIRAYLRGTKLQFYGGTSAGQFPVRGSTQDNAFNASATGITAVVVAGASVTRLTSWPLTSSAYNVLPTS